MKTKLFTLLGAALVMVSGVALAVDDDTTRSVGAFPAVYDDYPESKVVVSVTDDIVLTVTGEARVRFEWVENTTDFSSDGVEAEADDDAFDDNYDFAPARMNLGFRVDLPRDVAAVIELQGAWDLGGNDGFATDERFMVSQALRPGALNAFAHGPSPSADYFSKPGDSANTSDVDGDRDLREDASDTVHVYQGYLEMANIGDSIFSMRFGRQELAYGTEFLLGNEDFYDGRSWDGAKGIFQFNDCSRLDLFWAKVAEFNTSARSSLTSGSGNGVDEDEDLYGAYASFSSLGGSKIGMDAYIIGLHDRADVESFFNTTSGYATSGSDDLTDNADLGSYLEAWWLGVRFFRDVPHGLHFSAEITYLTGDFNTDLTRPKSGGGTEVIDEMDISAWAFEGFLGYTWDTPTNPTLHVGATYASGQSHEDIDSGDWNTFFTPAGEIHPRLGLMDVVEAQNIMAWTIGYSGSNGNHAWGVDAWHFEQEETDPFADTAFLSTATLNARGGEGFDEELGNELDLWYNYQYSENLVAQFAIGYFDAGNFIEEVNNCAGGNCDPDLAAPATTAILTDDAVRFYANLLVRF